MKVFVLIFGYYHEGYDSNVRVFTSRERAVLEGKEVYLNEGYDYYSVEEVEVEG